MLNAFYLARQTVVFRTREPMRLPVYKGSTFRGALGHALKQISCHRDGECARCGQRFDCAYSVCFETPVPDDAAVMRRYPFAPHPFVLEPPADSSTEYPEGTEFSVGLTLVGRGNKYFVYFISAMMRMGNTGLGKERAGLDLLRVDTCDSDGTRRTLFQKGKDILEGEAETITYQDILKRARVFENRPLRLVFETPLRIKVRGHFCETPSLRDLFPSLLRRVSSLHYFHCGGAFLEDVHPLLDAAATVKTRKQELKWMDWTRYSNRQKRHTQMGGVTGILEVEPVPAELLPLLLLGAEVHIGKGSAFGLGKYRIEAL